MTDDLGFEMASLKVRMSAATPDWSAGDPPAMSARREKCVASHKLGDLFFKAQITKDG